MSGSTQDVGERLDDLVVKRDEYGLEKAKADDWDARIMRWIIFGALIATFLISLVGLIFYDSLIAGYILTAVVSGIAGNMVQTQLTEFLGIGLDRSRPRD